MGGLQVVTKLAQEAQREGHRGRQAWLYTWARRHTLQKRLQVFWNVVRLIAPIEDLIEHKSADDIILSLEKAVDREASKQRV
jgi:hypothetical protein